MSWDEDFDGTSPGAEETDASEAAGVRPDAEETARALAKLKPLEYEQRREAAAKELGIRVSALDAAVSRYRGDDKGADEDAAPDLVEDTKAWPGPVSGLELADEIRDHLLAHVVFPNDGDADAATLWIFGTYLMDAWRLFPKLLISSPEKRCGKSTLLEVVEAHAARALMTANITAASLFRVIEAAQPTLLIDEADRFLRENEEANGIINAGHTRRTARVIRTIEVNGNYEPQVFSVWGAQAIAGIGSQADTLEDRSVRIGLRRRLRTEIVSELPVEYFEQRGPARQRLVKWADDVRGRIGDLTIQPGDVGNDRARNNWTPLYRIAALLGGAWPERVSTAYLLKEIDDDDHDEPAAVMLLRDVMSLFDEFGGERLQSMDLVAWLIEMEDRPWPEWRRGQPMTTNSLSRLLRQFDIRPRKLRIGTKPLMGYERAAVVEAFERYCQQPPAQTGTPEQVNDINGLARPQPGTNSNDVPG